MRRYFLVSTWSSIVKRRNATSFVSFLMILSRKSANDFPPYLMEALEIYFPGYPPYPQETTGYWLHLTNKLTFTQCNVVTTRQPTNTARIDHCGQSQREVSPPRTAHDMLIVCLLLFRALILNSTRTSRRLNLRPIKKTRWKKSRQVKGTWLISDRMRPSYPQFHRFFPHFKRLLRRQNTVHRPLTRVPFSKSNWVASRLLYE
jgi:hypothetical protein